MASFDPNLTAEENCKVSNEQRNGFRYHAEDGAIIRAEQCGCTIEYVLEPTPRGDARWSSNICGELRGKTCRGHLGGR